MDIASLIGFLGAVGMIAGAMISSGGIGAFIDTPSLLIVVGGTFFAVMYTAPLPVFLGSFGVMAKAFLPPDPKISSVPILPLDNRKKKYGYAGTGVAPAENHIFLFEDEPSYCKRLGLVWKLKEINLKEDQGIITARRESKSGNGDVNEETFSIDKATRFWRGKEHLHLKLLCYLC